MLDYFEEFGKSKKLLTIFEVFNNRYKKNHVEKTKIKREEEVLEVENSTPDEDMPPNDKIVAELTYLGYPETTCPNLPPNYVMVIDMLTKFTHPKLTIYRLSDGAIATAKVKKAFFDENVINQYDIIKILDVKQEKKRKKLSDGT